MGFIMTPSHTSFSLFHCLPLASEGSFYLTDLVSSHFHAFFPLLADLGVRDCRHVREGLFTEARATRQVGKS